MSEKKFDRMRALRPLATRDYRLLFAAVGIEVFGTGMWTIVMVFQVLALDDSPLALSAVATGMSLGLFAFSILGGVVAQIGSTVYDGSVSRQLTRMRTALATEA